MVRQPTPLLWAGNRIVNEKMHLSKKLLLLLNVQKSHFSMTFNAPGIQSVDALPPSEFLFYYIDETPPVLSHSSGHWDSVVLFSVWNLLLSLAY